MKCCSRSSLGVIIGAMNILLYIGASIVVIEMIRNDAFGLNNKTRTFDEREEIVAWSTILLSTILSACLLMVLLSGLLIVGIVKRRHKLMWPWLALSGIAFVCSGIRVLVTVVVGSANGIPASSLLIILLVGVLGMGIQALILWPIYTLCRDISFKNDQKKGELLNGMRYNVVTADAPPKYSCEFGSLPEKILPYN